jgi:hypothetical protein
MRKLLLSTLLVAGGLTMSVSAQAQKAVLKNVASGLYWAAGNNWGTRASLMPSAEFQTLHQQPDGTYRMETQVSNGGSSYYFGGDYMDGAPVNLTLTKSGDYYTVTNGTATYGNSTEAGSYGGSFILGKNASGDDALWQIIFEDDWDDYMATASENNPIDATFYILDANFGRNNRHGKAGENNDLGSAWTMQASNQNISGGTNENRCAESWQSSFTLSQTLNVPNGKYLVRAQAALTDYTNAYDGTDYPVVYANEASSPFKNMEGSDIGSNMGTLSNAFAAGKYEVEPVAVTVTDNKLTIGVRGTRTNTWCIWDNFRLTYLGVDLSALVDAYEAALQEAKQMQQTSETVSQKVMDDLAAAIQEYSSIDTTSQKELEEAITALKNATAAVVTSAQSYKTLAQVNFDPNSAAGWVATNGGNCRINTWSVEGDTDGSGLSTPFIENWINGWGGDVLRDGQVYYTLAGLEPGLKVKVSALVRAYSEVGNDIAGAYFFAGDQRTDIANEGTKGTNGTAKLAYGTFSTIATVDETGVLRFGVETANATFNFFGLKNVSTEIVPPSPDVAFTSFTAPAKVLINDNTRSFDVNVVVSNIGDADAKNVVVKLYEGSEVVATYPSADPTTGADGAPTEGLTLPAGEKLEFTMTYDKELVHGKTLSLRAVVECADEYTDYQDNNESSTTSVKLVMDGSDVTITGATCENVVRMGEEDKSVDVEVTVKVKNLGTQPADGVTVELTDADGNIVASSDPISVEAGQEQEVVVTFTATEAGAYSFTATVKADADIDEENNTYSEPVEFKVKKTGELVEGIDGEIVEIEAEGADGEGGVAVDNETGGITVNVTVANNGKETANNMVVTLYVNGEAYATNADVEGFETINLEGADEVVVPFFIEISDFTDYEVYAEVSVEGDVDPENNVSDVLSFTAIYDGIDVALLDVLYPEAIAMDSEEDAIVTVMVKNVSQSSTLPDDKLKAENIVVHLFIDGVEVAQSKPFSLYKDADAHAYLAIDRQYLTSENVVLTARVTADGDGNESNDWSEELPIQVSGVVTGIDGILARFGQNAQVYTLDGKKVDLSSGMLKKGLYIVNGKKAAIK